MADDLLAGLDFSEALRDTDKGLLLKPAIHTFLFDAEYPDDFAVRFRKGDQVREPDGWFWPSTHPTWSERALYLYLTTPEALPREHIRYMNALSLTMGTALHGFFERCLEMMGLRPKDLNTCRSCPPERGCTEPGFRDENTGSRGHMDGLLDLTSLKPERQELEYPGLEFKTTGQRNLATLSDLDVEAYRRKWPVYYAQNQEYMRLSGIRTIVVLIMALGYPWETREIHVPYDPVYAGILRDKYLSVREAVETKNEPGCCGRIKSCAAGGHCQVKTEGPAKRFLLKKDGTYGYR